MKKVIGVLAGIIAAGMVVGILAGVGRLPVGSQEASDASGKLRWLNVTIQLPPEESPLRVTRGFPPGPQSPRYLISIYVKEPHEPGVEPSYPALRIDAE